MSATTVAITLSPVAVAANTTAEQLFNLPAIEQDVNIEPPQYAVVVSKPTQQAGLGIAGARYVPDSGGASTFAQVGITFINATGSPITPTAAEAYLVGLTWRG